MALEDIVSDDIKTIGDKRTKILEIRKIKIKKTMLTY